MIDYLMPFPVESGSQTLLGKRHSDRIGEPLAERPGGRLDSGQIAILGVAGGLAVQLSEILQIIKRNLITTQMEQRIEQHRSMSVGKDEAVAVRPPGVLRIMLHHSSKRTSAISAIPMGAPGDRSSPLYSIHAQDSNCIGKLFYVHHILHV